MHLEPFVFRHEGAMIAARDLTGCEPDAQEDRDEVNRFALRPLRDDEFVVFTMDLCHNQVDRHFSRFPEEELQRISAMTPGRPLMERHDLRGSLPRGTFFRSRLHRDDSRVSVRPDVYVLRTQDNADFILNIEGGVYRETSIGFSFEMPECSICGRDLRTCDHVPGRTYGDAACHYVMRRVLDVIEGSVVPSGSQGTRFVASGARTRDRESILPLSRALAVARAEFHRPIELSTPFTWAEE